MQCKTCGATLPDNIHYCPACCSGVSIRCKRCGYVMHKNAKYCGMCGADMSDESKDAMSVTQKNAYVSCTQTSAKFSVYDYAILLAVITGIMLICLAMILGDYAVKEKFAYILAVPAASCLIFDNPPQVILVTAVFNVISLVGVLVCMFKEEQKRLVVLSYLALVWAWTTCIAIAVVLFLLLIGGRSGNSKKRVRKRK